MQRMLELTDSDGAGEGPVARIGIFWFYRDQVFGRSCDLEEGHEYVPGILDAPYSHADLWENPHGFTIPFAELRDAEYQDVPRGRVVYAREPQRAIVYMDESIGSKAARQAVLDFFELSGARTEWRRDEHYTTDPDRLRKLFSEGED